MINVNFVCECDNVVQKKIKELNLHVINVVKKEVGDKCNLFTSPHVCLLNLFKQFHACVSTKPLAFAKWYFLVRNAIKWTWERSSSTWHPFITILVLLMAMEIKVINVDYKLPLRINLNVPRTYTNTPSL